MVPLLVTALMLAPTVLEETSKFAVERLYSAIVSTETGEPMYGMPFEFRPNGSPTLTESTLIAL